jgi:hypothetical protein
MVGQLEAARLAPPLRQPPQRRQNPCCRPSARASSRPSVVATRQPPHWIAPLAPQRALTGRPSTSASSAAATGAARAPDNRFFTPRVIVLMPWPSALSAQSRSCGAVGGGGRGGGRRVEEAAAERAVMCLPRNPAAAQAAIASRHALLLRAWNGSRPSLHHQQASRCCRPPRQRGRRPRAPRRHRRPPPRPADRPRADCGGGAPHMTGPSCQRPPPAQGGGRRGMRS